MNWLKAITKSGRQSIARELLREYLTPKQLSAWAADGANRLLGSIGDKERLNRIAGTVNSAADLAADISAAVRDGHVTGEEAAQICAKASTLASDVLTKERIDALIEKAVSYVP